MLHVGAIAAAEPHEAQKPAPCRGRPLLWCGLTAFALFALLAGAATGAARPVDLDALIDGRDGRSAPVVVYERDDPGAVVGIAGDTAGDQAQVAIQARALVDDEGIPVAPSASGDDGNFTAGCADTVAEGSTPPRTNREEGGGGGGGGDTSASHEEDDDDDDDDEEMCVAADDGDDEDDGDDNEDDGDGDGADRRGALDGAAARSAPGLRRVYGPPNLHAPVVRPQAAVGSSERSAEDHTDARKTDEDRIRAALSALRATKAGEVDAELENRAMNAVHALADAYERSQFDSARLAPDAEYERSVQLISRVTITTPMGTLHTHQTTPAGMTTAPKRHAKKGPWQDRQTNVHSSVAVCGHSPGGWSVVVVVSGRVLPLPFQDAATTRGGRHRLPPPKCSPSFY